MRVYSGKICWFPTKAVTLRIRIRASESAKDAPPREEFFRCRKWKISNIKKPSDRMAYQVHAVGAKGNVIDEGQVLCRGGDGLFGIQVPDLNSRIVRSGRYEFPIRTVDETRYRKLMREAE